MLKKRIIACLDVQDGRVVKGTNFIHLKDLGNPIELAMKYQDQGVDELVFLDIKASPSKSKTNLKWVEEMGRKLSIPFTVGGGISSLEDATKVIEAGADKLSLNTAAFRTPSLISEVKTKFGKQAVILAIDGYYEHHEFRVAIQGGKMKTSKPVLDWAKEGEDFGAGEILLTSMSHDGTQAGFDLKALVKLSEKVSIPIIASGGAGSPSDFLELFQNTAVEAGLAAGIFHRNEVSIPTLKEFLISNNIPIRSC